MCAMSWCNIGVTFDLGSARIFTTVIFERCFSFHKGNPAISMDSYASINKLIDQLINFTAS